MSDAESLRARVFARVGPLQIEVELDTGPQTLVIVGPNGAGKSSLLSLLLGVLPIERGRITIGRAALFDAELGVDTPIEHRRLGYVPQDFALFPHLSVRQNVAFALTSAAPTLGPKAHQDRVEGLLVELGLEAFGDRRPGTLSGGEKQRVALARALAVGPRALLLDEPLAALDLHCRRQVRRFLGAYLAKLRLPTIVVTHDPEDARALGHQVLVLEAGRVTQSGPWQALAEAPASPFIEALVTSVTSSLG